MAERSLKLEIRDMTKRYDNGDGVEHINLKIYEGEIVTMLGPSGCGKSTLGRVILGLTDATSGSVLFDGEETVGASKKRRFQLRKDMQMIFQDPFSSLDPRMCVSELIEEPLIIYKAYADANERSRRVSELMETVGLAERLRYSYPHELDGGRRQRIGIARALALNPRFIVCDEPVSALDVSIQAQILNLMQDLQEQYGLTYICLLYFYYARSFRRKTHFRRNYGDVPWLYRRAVQRKDFISAALTSLHQGTPFCHSQAGHSRIQE